MTPGTGDDSSPTIARVKSGDRAALGVLLERHAHYLRLLVRLQLGRRLRPKFDVDDLLQDVFLEVHRRIDRFEGTSPHEFLGWLRRIVATVLSNKIRHYVGT
ncbi:MAG: sigma factor [Isosphaeraceae bacterium]